MTMGGTVSLVRLLSGDVPQAAKYETYGDGLTTDYVLPERPVVIGSTRVTLAGTLLALTTDYTANEKAGALYLTVPAPLDALLSASYQWSQFADDDLQSLLSLEYGDARMAAADALDAIASNATLLQGRITMLDLTMDGTAVAKSLRDHAKNLRDQSLNTADFDWAEAVYGTNQQEKLIAEILRQSSGVGGV